MTAYRISYRGPAELALDAATRLADADGVELKASEPPERAGTDDIVVLILTVEGNGDAVDAALQELRDELPAEASVTVDRSECP